METSDFLFNGLVCKLSIEDGKYFISNEFYDITVWGNTRAEVEEALEFAINAIIKVYAKEDDCNLHEDAIEFKQKIREHLKL